MVNFDNETTIGTASVDIMRVLILEKRTNVIESLEAINKRSEVDYNQLYTLRARIQSLYWELEGMLKRKYEEDELKKELLDSLFIPSNQLKIEELLKTFSFMNRYLDELRLTRIDTKAVYDRRRVENVNKRNHV